jgi:hypothetical protein
MVTSSGARLADDHLRGVVRRARAQVRVGDYSEDELAVTQLAELLNDATQDRTMTADTHARIRHVLGDETS